MKRTDQERIERELRRREKQVKVANRRTDGNTDDDVVREKVSPGTYIKDLHALFEFDEHQIYNTRDDDNVLELLLMMKEDLEQKHWDSVLRSAIRKTKVAEKDVAFSELKESLGDC